MFVLIYSSQINTEWNTQINTLVIRSLQKQKRNGHSICANVWGNNGAVQYNNVYNLARFVCLSITLPIYCWWYLFLLLFSLMNAQCAYTDPVSAVIIATDSIVAFNNCCGGFDSLWIFSACTLVAFSAINLNPIFQTHTQSVNNQWYCTIQF